ncbi:DUF2179 domain-containing protein [Desulfococcus sp.]|jgi:uncharacterized protein YebE (UPF0316 family)|uniref:DUF2179 domain-containing protein n=1 Tax=Desulfococcus sp. TaxID=2025834 RepID=UPI0035933956
MESTILFTGILIFFARIFDVALGTLRTIVTVQGRTVNAFFLGIAEVIIWILVVSTVVNQIKESPVLILFYALGFASGNVVGILVERKLAFGNIVLRIISTKRGNALANELRAAGQPVTVFVGEGMHGPVKELYVVCRRRDMKRLLSVVDSIDASAFIITEMARDVNKILHPFRVPFTGWRSATKNK